MGEVIGVGGVFFRSKDAAKLRAWYAEHLGFKPQADGVVEFSWAAPGSDRDTLTVWGPFDKSPYGAGISSSTTVSPI